MMHSQGDVKSSPNHRAARKCKLGGRDGVREVFSGTGPISVLYKNMYGTGL